MLNVIQDHLNLIWAFIVCCILNTAIFIFPIPVFYLPDLLLLAYLIYKFPDLNQEISPLFFLGLILLVGFFLFSPEPPDSEFTNNYLVALKPFFYICVLAAYSKNIPKIEIIRGVRIFLVIYPLILLWNLFLVHLKENAGLAQLMSTRPFFIFENNFEITFYLNCFCIAFFIYKERDWKKFALLVSVIILAGSRSGLLSFAVICIFYFFAVSWKQKITVAILAMLTTFYIAKGRNIGAPIGTIDRVQSLQAILTHYNSNLMEILSTPFGFGIYEKVPRYICIKLPDFAEWFTGNSHNCDPLMLQAFYTRALFQFGIYITLSIPFIFLAITKKETGLKLAVIILAPITCVATSVGGFSNGLAFWGILISVFAYLQHQQTIALKQNLI